jgi:hypothetical protein
MYRLIIVAFVLVLTSCVTSSATTAEAVAPSSDKKIKVYILAGQSNMEEKAGIEALACQVGQERTKNRYTHLIKDGDHAAFTKMFNETRTKPLKSFHDTMQRDKKKKPTPASYNFSTRKDVWLSNHRHHSDLTLNYASPTKFGLEVNFAHAMGDAHDEQVLIIKTAWGGKSVDVDYRSPSGMPTEKELKAEWDGLVEKNNENHKKAVAAYPKKVANYEKKLAAYNKALKDKDNKKKLKKPKKPRAPTKAGKGRGPKSFEEYKDRYGYYYREMISEVKEVLANLKTHHPDYKGQGYEIKGFVWFQGYNDMFSDKARNNYAKNLVKIIKDVKSELKVEKLNVVIGQMGHHGDQKGLYQETKDKKTGKMVMSGNGAIRKAQLQASQHPDIKNFTALVRTAPFWDVEAEAVFGGKGKDSWSNNYDKWVAVGADRPYHYLGSPWFFSQAGTAFGKAMIKLENK